MVTSNQFALFIISINWAGRVISLNMRLITENLSCVRGGRAIFSDLSFEVGAGECLLLLGANGAGKTSLLRMLAGYLRPAGGAIHVKDVEREDGDEVTVAESCHFVGHLNGVKSQFTVRENLAFWAGYLSGEGGRVSHEEAIEGALDGFALNSLGEIPAGYLSAGQKRRLCLARLLVARRPIWLLDEPTVSLDKKSQTYLADAVNDHVRGGGLAIAATHLELGIENARELALGATPGARDGGKAGRK